MKMTECLVDAEPSLLFGPKATSAPSFPCHFNAALFFFWQGTSVRFFQSNAHFGPHLKLKQFHLVDRFGVGGWNWRSYNQSTPFNFGKYTNIAPCQRWVTSASQTGTCQQNQRARRELAIWFSPSFPVSKQSEGNKFLPREVCIKFYGEILKCRELYQKKMNSPIFFLNFDPPPKLKGLYIFDADLLKVEQSPLPRFWEPGRGRLRQLVKQIKELKCG